jgi:hypothetical protein
LGEIGLSRFASRQFRHRVALLLGICWAADAAALGVTTPNPAPVAIAFVLSLWLIVVGIVFCVYIRDEPGEGKGDTGESPGGGGDGGGGPPRNPRPYDGPAWWPKFEREFRAYAEQERRVPLRTP